MDQEVRTFYQVENTKIIARNHVNDEIHCSCRAKSLSF